MRCTENRPLTRVTIPLFLTVFGVLLIYIQHGRGHGRTLVTIPCDLTEFSAFPGVPSVECLQEDVHCFVKTTLREWRGRFVKRERLEDLWNSAVPENIERLGGLYAMVQIIDNKIYYGGNLQSRPIEGWWQDMYRARTRSVFNVLFAALSRGSLPDTEFVFSVGDCVAHHNPHPSMPLVDSEMFPAFTMVSCIGSASIAFPYFDVYRPPNDVSLADWPEVVLSIKANRDAHPWATRSSRLVYRGGTGRMCSTCATQDGYSPQSLLWQGDGKDMCSRHKALEIEHTDNRYDFSTNHPRELTMPMHDEFKYVLYLHGQCHWAARLRRFLFQGLVLFKQVGLCDEFYGLRLRPWVHYIPVDYNLNNLSASLDWAIANEDSVFKIIKNMHDYAEKFNTARFAIKYAFELLHAYSKLLDYNVTLRPQLDYLPTIDSFEATFNRQIARGRNI